ncbi:hypothetical protein [Pseudomonas moorei]|uniref:hypothetical protein n=1 Tax=Pseudomonas moorei TaxID=395599 RepID=UPI00200FF6E2|nr:hypothetical protein [Pseudomonas moorei]
MPDTHNPPSEPIIQKTFLGSPVIFRQDGCIDFKSFAETFGLSPETIASALHAFERMVETEPQWTSAISAGTTASTPTEKHLWMPLKVFNHVGAFLEVHQEFPQWYATTVTNLAIHEAHHRTTEVTA